MAGVAPPKTVGVPTSTTQHLQGLLVRKTATAEPKSLAQYFNHVTDAVSANDELTALRLSHLKRRAQVAAHGYEAVLNRKKRAAVHVSRPSVTGPAYLTRAAPAQAAATTPSAAAAQVAQAAHAAAQAQAASSAAQAAAATRAAASAAAQAAIAGNATATTTTTTAQNQNENKSHPNPAAMVAAAAAAAAVSARAAAAAKAAVRPVVPVAVAPAKPTLLVHPAAPKPTSAVPIQSAAGLRPTPATMVAASPAITSAAPTPTPLIPASLAVVKPAQLHVPQSVMSTPQPIPMPASLAQTSQPPLQPQPLQPQTLQPQPVAVAQALPRRSDFVVGTRVMIRHTADLVACGARNLVGKTGRIVAVPQVYGQEVYSVYIDEHETMFQVPFNALVLISPPAPTPMPINMQHQPPPRTMHQLAPGGMVSQAQPQVQPVTSVVSAVMQPTAAVPTAAHGMRPTPSIEDIKLEHSYQLHRLMQQQYREIQVLQQQYAECRLVNPAALPSIQKELSKLRLVHLSQVQTLKSKQALDLLGK